MIFATVDQAIKEVQKGNYLIIVDDENRENEGDLMIAAEKATPQKLNYFFVHAGGLMCAPMSGERLDSLEIPMMVDKPTDKLQTPFTVSVDAKRNTTTGMSAHDRMETLKALLDGKTDDLARPGHMFPLRSSENGVLERPGHTEAAVDLCKLAGVKPVAVIAEIMNDDGSMSKLEDLERFAEDKDLLILKIRDLVKFRIKESS